MSIRRARPARSGETVRTPSAESGQILQRWLEPLHWRRLAAGRGTSSCALLRVRHRSASAPRRQRFPRIDTPRDLLVVGPCHPMTAESTPSRSRIFAMFACSDRYFRNIARGPVRGLGNRLPRAPAPFPRAPAPFPPAPAPFPPAPAPLPPAPASVPSSASGAPSSASTRSLQRQHPFPPVAAPAPSRRSFH